MSLLSEDEEEIISKQSNKKKKLVLTLLIISIILLVFAIAIVSVLPTNQDNPLTLTVNNLNSEISEDLLISDQEGVTTYISLKKLASMIGYKYLQGGYLEFTEDLTKCYLESDYQIIGFETNSNKIYKTKQNSEVEYQYYELSNNIIKSDNDLYIALDDLNVGCNVVYTYSQEKNNINIETPQFIAEQKDATFTEGSTYSNVSQEFDNQKAIAYNMLVVTDKSKKVGVVTNDLETVISAKYSSMLFDEYTQSFIVSNNNKYGVISKEGKLVIDLKYEDIRIIKYEPILYEVKKNNKYGILDENGNLLVELEYDSLGYPGNKLIGANATLLIKDVNKEENGIVVKRDGKYGVVSLATGKIIGACELDAIYSKTDELGQDNYYIMLQNQQYTLKEYIDIRNTVEVNLSNN